MEQERHATAHSEWLSADRPISNRDQDELGRRGFSESFANAIRGWSGRDSLVLALYGVWGNGKSSIKNMTIESLSQSAPTVRSVDFNPWQLAARPSMTEAFFDELGVALEKGDLGTRGQRRSTLDKLRRLALRLQGARDLAKATRNLVGVILLFFGLITLGSAWVSPRFLSVALGILTIAMALLALSTGLVESVVKLLAAGVEVGQKNLSEIKLEIAQDLKRLKTPILVTLDDLDRLTPPELVEVFQLIKANGDFPNVIYLILCDRTIVEANIAKVLNVSGRDYLEKIVQVAFDVPMIDIDRVRQVLFTRLNGILSAEGVSVHFNQTRWANVFWSGLHSYFSTLRDVNRFVSTFSFHIASFSSGGALEVNPIDLIVLETLRLNEPDVYKALQSNKEVLTSQKSRDRDTKSAKRALESIVGLASEERRSELTELLKHLFPTIEWAFEGPSYSAEFGQEWYRDLRVCVPKLFDRYFRLSVSDKELTQAVILKLLSLRGNRNELRTMLEMLNERKLLSLAIEELAVHQNELEATQVQAFITAILDVGGLLPDATPGTFDIPTQWRIGILIQNALEKLDTVESRAKVLAEAIGETSGLIMAAEVAQLLTAKSEDENRPPIIPEPASDEVRRATVRRIELAASSGGLQDDPSLGKLLGVWKAWGSADKAENFAEKIASTPEGALAMLTSLEQRAFYHQIGDHAGTTRYYFQRNIIEPLVSMDLLDKQLKGLAQENLDEQGSRVVRNFQKAMERRRDGKPDIMPPFVD